MRSFMPTLLLASLAALAIPTAAQAAGYFSGWINVDENHKCTIKAGTDSAKLTCSYSDDSEYNLPTVTLDFHTFALKTPPICTLTGLTLNGVNGRNGAGGQPVVADLTSSKLRIVMNNLQDCPCQYGGMALFTCMISN